MGANHEARYEEMAKTMAQEIGRITGSHGAIASHARASKPQDATQGAPKHDEEPLVEGNPVAIGTKRERLTQLRQQFDELTESLALSGKKRQGTDWQRDRLRAREQIRREMETLEDIPPVAIFDATEY